MSIFTDVERARLTEMRAIGKDSQGRDVLVGLSLDETAFYMEYFRREFQRDHDPADSSRYLELYEKHEQARLSILGAEHQLRTEKPPLH